MRKPLIAGNWKMHKTISESQALVKSLRDSLDGVSDRDSALCPPFTALAVVAYALKGSPIALGAQNVYWEKQGAFTGEVSPGMLSDVGCRYVIVGHSERRQFFGETDETVRKRALSVLAVGLAPIVCVGETLQEREGNSTFSVVEKQMKDGLKELPAGASIVIAYEPVWAIGTGKTATPAQAQEVHSFIRKTYAGLYGDSLAQTVRILYGGSVKPDNMSALMSQPDIDGGLVGGASLDADSFSKIVRYR
jgi:triosephosphate isomerase (TIM)